MEALGGNHNRKLEQSQDLVQFSAPRCAVSVLSSRVSLEKINMTLTVQTPTQHSVALVKTKTITYKNAHVSK